MRGSVHAHVLVSLFILAVLISPVPVSAAGPSAITVPSGFTVTPIASISSGELNDIEVGEGAFGEYLYYLTSNDAHDAGTLHRVDPGGGTPEEFATGMPVEAVMAFGYDGDLFVAGHDKIMRVSPSGTASVFLSGSYSFEGIAFDGVTLYVSDFPEGNTIYKVDNLGTMTAWTSKPGGGGSIRGLVFGPGGAFGAGLYTLNEYTSGTIDVVDQNGQWSEFISGWSPGMAEFLAFSDPSSSFGSYMYVAVAGSALWRITPSKEAAVFADGFTSFSTDGVTGIRFSDDGETLFVTDDNAGIVYAIHNVEPFPRTCSVNGLSTDKSYYYLGETVSVALCYQQPSYCTSDIVTYDVIVLHEGSQVAQLGTFQGSSTLGCWHPKDYEYTPTDDGLYTVQFVRETLGSPFLISEAQFLVGYGNANGSPVGGVITPADKLVVLVPYLVLIGFVGAAALLASRKKRRS